jgi:hypothetical protein
MIRVIGPSIRTSRVSNKRVSVQADILSDNSRLPPKFTLWFDIAETYADDVSVSGNPWLSLLIPLAVNLHEPLAIEAPVDAALLSNVRELMAIWSSWYPHLRPVTIKAEGGESGALEEGHLTAAFFSSGVDAWFSLLSHVNGTTHPRLDDLLTVWGLDIPVDNLQDRHSLQNAQERVADSFGLNGIIIATNLRETAWWQEAEWGRLAHGCALSSMGLILQRRYKNLLIPSSHSYDSLTPWGSHPLTDPFLSTSSMRVIHDGARFSRVEKTEFISHSDIAMGMLQVCWASGAFKNCGACEKCCRTSTTLELLGALDRCKTLQRATTAPRMLTRYFPQDESGRIFHREIRRLAVEKGNRGVIRAIDKGLRRSLYHEGLNEIRHRLGKIRLLRVLRELLKGRLGEEARIRCEPR